MGNRRMGLSRLEALLEKVDRDLNLVNSTLTNCTITTSAAVTLSGTTTISGATTLSGALKGTVGVVYASSGVVTSGATFNSGAMTVPAGSIIIDMGCVVTTTVAAASGVFGVRFGTTANAVDLAALDADGLESAGTAVAVGVGTAMDAVLQTALGGTAVVVMDAGDAWRAAETAVHGSVLSAGGSITGGAISFWVKYITVL
jgi:hypothetical protein